MAKLSKFIDTSKCTACRACQVACKQWNELPAEKVQYMGTFQTVFDTSPNTFTYVSMKESFADGKHTWTFAKQGCLHCTEASCEKVCPEGAISHSATGVVVRDEEKCIGCGYCAQYCPFNIPKIDKTSKKMSKCHLCSDRVANNLEPACAKTCAPGAIEFGDRDKLVQSAKARLAEVKKVYPDANLYGLDEQFLAGTNVFYLLTEKPEYYGLPAKPAVPTAAIIWKDVISPIGKVLPVAAISAIAVSAAWIRLKGKSPEKGGHE